MDTHNAFGLAADAAIWERPVHGTPPLRPVLASTVAAAVLGLGAFLGIRAATGHSTAGTFGAPGGFPGQGGPPPGAFGGPGLGGPAFEAPGGPA